MRYFLSLIILLLLFPNLLIGQNPIFELNKKLGKGINLGNMFEAPSENEWGNPFKDDYLKKIKSAGFSHVRIPIRWDVPGRTNLNSPYTLDPTFINRIKYVIDKALEENLMVIINMHHHEEIFSNPEVSKPRFLSQWTQIANYFKAYDSRLLFEVMNEPHDKLTPALWNQYFKEALATIRVQNPTRAVLIGTANYGGLSGLANLEIPNDPNLILTVHYYDPFNFTHQGAEWVADADKWLGTKWENTNLERNQITSQFSFLKTLATAKNIPVHIGEFGAYSKADLDSRLKWTNYLARWFETQGYSWAYWEFSAGFGIYNPSTSLFNVSLVDALMKNPMTEATKVDTKIIYEANFANKDWTLNTQAGALASVIYHQNSVIVDVQKITDLGWHVQFQKANINLTNGKKYLVTIKGISNKPTSITQYFGKASNPYNAYSGYNNFTFSTLENTFQYTFTMTSPTDQASRTVFDLGGTLAQINISKFVIEEIVPNTPAPLSLENYKWIVLSPNPTVNEIQISGDLSVYSMLSIFDLSGKIIENKPISATETCRLSTEHLKIGTYILYLHGKMDSKAIKFVKQ